MSPSRSDPVLDRLREKVRLVEKGGHFNTVHHYNLERYLKTIRPKPKKAKAKKSEVKEDTNGN